jgi:hypothetical protein
MPALFGTYTPSGTFTFYPSNAEIIAGAYGRIQIRRTEIEPQHIIDGVAELNFFLSAFNAVGPNLAQIDQQSFPLVQGTATYTLPAETVMVTDMFLTYPSGGATSDAYMFPISRTEYAALPNKTTQQRPNQYWLNRQQVPQATFYPTPDGNGPYTVKYFRFRQVQDSVVANSISPEVPNRALDCVIAGLAHRLARIYRPEVEDKRKVDAGEAWAIYAKQDTENVNLYLQPGLAAYWRQ